MKKQWFFFFLVVFFLLRLLTVIEFGQSQSEFQDAKSYDSYATEIVSGSDWLFSSDFYGNHREPIYPLFISLVYLIFGIHNYLVVYIFQAIFSTISLWIIYKFSNLLFNNNLIASVSSFIWAGVYYFYFKYVGQIIRETFEVFFVLLFFYSLFVLLRNQKPNIKKIIYLSFIFFILTHLNGKYLFFTPFLVVYFIYNIGLIKGIKQYSLFLIFFIVFSLPWLIRNIIVYDKIVIINTRTYQHDINHKNIDYEDNTAKKSLLFGTIKELNNDKGLSEEEANQILKGENRKNREIDFINAVKKGKRPAETYWERRWFMLKQFWRVTNFDGDFFPMPSGKFNIWSLRHNMANILYYGMALLFSILGFSRLVLEKNKIALLYTTYPLLIDSLLHTLIWSRERYRLPFDAFIIILAGYGFYYLYIIIKNKWLNIKE